MTWVFDTEYAADDGERCRPHTLCAVQIETGRELSFHLEELASLKRSPFSDEPVVCFSAGADVGAMLELGLERPKVVRDLSPAFNLYANGVLPGGKGTRSLAAACARFGIRHASILEKDALQQRCAKGPPFTLEESQRIPHYCMDDVCATAGLYGKLWPTDDIEQWRAELRSRYTSCLAEVYRLGTPIDLPLYCEIVENLPAITRGLMNRDAINREIYADGTFNMRRFAEALRDRGIVRWPLTETTRALRTDRRTLETMVLRHPELAPFRDLKSLLDVLDEQAITVGPSGRNRCFQGPFIAKTGRDAPRGRIWNLATWWFNLVRPEPGTSLIHADYKAQEFGTLAVLSGDPVMLDEYPRDPFTIRAKAANLPRGAVKTATFAKFYGAGFDRLAEVLGRGNVPAFESSMSVYRRAWQWLARRTLRARIEHKIETYYGWRLAVSSATKATTLMNYPIQGNAGEITRLALIYAVEAGLRICAVIHDALVAECERGKEAETIAMLRDVMERASRRILGGYTLMITLKIIADRYDDERGKDMWKMVMSELETIRRERVFQGSTDPSRHIAENPTDSAPEQAGSDTPEVAESNMVK